MENAVDWDACSAVLINTNNPKANVKERCLEILDAGLQELRSSSSIIKFALELSSLKNSRGTPCSNRSGVFFLISAIDFSGGGNKFYSSN